MLIYQLRNKNQNFALYVAIATFNFQYEFFVIQDSIIQINFTKQWEFVIYAPFAPGMHAGTRVSIDHRDYFLIRCVKFIFCYDVWFLITTVD